MDVRHGHVAPGRTARGEADPGVRTVEGLLELLVLPLVVHRAPAVPAAADDLLGGVAAGLPVRLGVGRGVRDLLPVHRDDHGGDGPSLCVHALGVLPGQGPGGRRGGQHAGEHQGQGRPAAEATGSETVCMARHEPECRTTPRRHTARRPHATRGARHTFRYLRNANSAATAGIRSPMARTSGSLVSTASQPMKSIRFSFSLRARPPSIRK